MRRAQSRFSQTPPLRKFAPGGMMLDPYGNPINVSGGMNGITSSLQTSQNQNLAGLTQGVKMPTSTPAPGAAPKAGGLGAGAASGIAAGASLLAGGMGGGKQLNAEYGATKAGAKMTNAAAKNDQVVNGVATAVQAVPVWGQIVGAGMKLGQAIGKQTKDQYGIHKSKGAAVVDNVFNPAAHLQNLKDIGKKGGLASFATLGLIKSPAQREAERQRDIFISKKGATNQLKTMQAGVSNSIPTYQAPAYGRNGMKFKTKFGKSC